MARSGGAGPNAIEQLRPGDERHAKASRRKHHTGVARVVLHVVDAALAGADGYGIGDEIRFQARLDDKQAADFAKLRHWLSQRRMNGAVPPFPD